MDSSCEPLDGLAALDLEALRRRWRTRYGDPPTIRSRELLMLMLAWRIQAEREGGVEPQARRAMRRATGAPALTSLPPGTRLMREWKGRPHEVIVEGDGRFRCGETVYGSLSEAARAITGSRWNGPRFFGLREKQA